MAPVTVQEKASCLQKQNQETAKRKGKLSYGKWTLQLLYCHVLKRFNSKIDINFDKIYVMPYDSLKYLSFLC